MLLKKENFPTIPLLMKSFIEVKSIPIPHLIDTKISKILLYDVLLREMGH